MRFPGEISTAALVYADLPGWDGPLHGQRGRDELPEIWKFAMSYRPPAELQLAVVAVLVPVVRKSWTRAREMPEIGLDGWRLCLWWEFHHWRHTGQGSGGDWASDEDEFTRALVKAIKTEVFRLESWWWEPGVKPTPKQRRVAALAGSDQGRDVQLLYARAVEILEAGIERTSGQLTLEPDPDPWGSPEDPVLAVRELAAEHIARGLLSKYASAGEDARDAARSLASRLAAGEPA